MKKIFTQLVFLLTITFFSLGSFANNTANLKDDKKSKSYCSGTTTLTGALGTITDGSGSNNYANYTDCKWLIQPANATKVTFTFTSFATESGMDKVKIYDGSTTSATLLGEFSGSSIPDPVSSSGGSLLIYFSSDYSDNDAGWEGSYSSSRSLSYPNLDLAEVTPSMAILNTYVNYSSQIKNNGDTATGDFNIGYYLSTDTVINSSDYLIEAISNSNIDINNFASISFDKDILSVNSTIPEGSYYFGLIADYEDNLVESNETDNSWIHKIKTVDIPHTHDASFSIKSNNTTVDGTTVTYNLKASNTGNTTLTVNEIGFYLSTDTIITADDIFIGDTSLSNITSRTDVSFSSSIDISSDAYPVSAGTYYIGCITDYKDSYNEISEDNNAWTDASSQITLSTNYGPNLTYSPTHNTVIINGSSISISLRVINDSSSTSGAAYVGYYLSPDTNVTADDIYVSADYFGTLSSGAYSDEDYTVDVTVSGASIPEGSYYLGYVIDYANSIAEYNERDNSWCYKGKQVVVNTDVGSNLSYDNTYHILNLNTNISIYTKIINTGTIATNIGDVGYYVSADSIITTDDYLFSSDLYGILSTSAYSNESTTHPISDLYQYLSPGVYYIGYIVDYKNTTNEYEEGDNAYCWTSQTIVIPKYPDLTFETADTNIVVSGYQVAADINVKNTGDTTSGTFYVGYYLSANAVIDGSDFLIDVDTVNGIGDGDSVDISNSMIADFENSGAPAGTYYFGYHIDYANSLVEKDETNNSFVYTAKTITIKYCESATTLTEESGSFTDGSGSYSYKNNRNCTWLIQPAGAKKITLAFNSFATQSNLDYVRVYDGASTSATLLGAFSGSVIPSGITSSGGSLLVQFVTDGSNTYAGWSASYSSVNTNIFPNLSINMVDVSISGTVVNATVQVKNTGDTLSKSSSIGYYLSSNTAINTSDRLVASKSIGSIISGDSATQNIIFDAIDLGSSLTAGYYYVGAITDYNNLIIETSETDNSWANTSQTVYIPSTTNLTYMPVYNNVTVNGSTVSVSMAALNNGNTHSGFTSTYVGYYLSDDTVITTDDCLMGTDYFYGLFSGGSSNESMSINLSSSSLALSIGTYHIGYIVDYQNAVTESNENDNTWFSPTETVTISKDMGPNLSYDNTYNSLSVSSNYISISMRVKNIGTSSSNSGYVGYYLSEDQTITTDDYLFGTDYFSSLTASSYSSESYAGNISSSGISAPAGTYYVGYIVDYSDAVSETNEDDNSWCGNGSNIVTLTSDVGPNLTPYAGNNSVTVNGTNLSYSAYIRNDGNTTSGSSYMAYYLSEDTIFTKADYKIGFDYVTTIYYGSYTSESWYGDVTTQGVAIPGGTYHIGYIIDTSEVIRETNENDNVWFSTTKTVVIPDYPDLSVDNTNSSVSISNDTISSNIRVQNIGDTTSGTIYLGYYLSTNTSINTSDYLIGIDTLSSLSSSGHINVSKKLLATMDALNIPAGTYYFGCIIDYSSAIAESDEYNNTYVYTYNYITLSYCESTTTLTDASGTFSDGSGAYTYGNNTNCKWLIQPTDAKKITLAFTEFSTESYSDYVKIYDGSTTSSTLLGTYSGSKIPSNITSSGGSLLIHFTSDNSLTSSGWTVSYNSINTTNFPNLTIDNSGSNASINGTEVDLTINVKNTGDTSSTSFDVGYYLSTNSTIATSDKLVSTKEMTAISNGSSSVQKHSFDVLENGNILTSGYYYLGAIADYNGLSIETDETDNTWSNTSQQVYVPSYINLTYIHDYNTVSVNGNSIAISMYATNNGNTRTNSTYAYVGYYLSADTNITVDDVLLTTDYFNYLSSGSYNYESMNVNLSNFGGSVAAGTYYIGYIIDYTGVVSESNENDNSWYSPTKTITVSSDIGPNLTFDDTYNSLSVSSNYISLSMRVKNAGNSISNSAYVGYYLSEDTNITTDDYLFGTDYFSSLSASSYSSESYNGNISSSGVSAPAGIYYIGYIIDYAEVVSETNETDNSWSGNSSNMVTLTADIGPNLTPYVGNNSVTVNGTTVSYTAYIRNDGNTTSGSSYMAYYLSEDTIFTKTDYKIGDDYVSSISNGSYAYENWSGDVTSLGISIPNGSYYLGYIIDTSDVISETNENDNTWHDPTQSVVIDVISGVNLTYDPNYSTYASLSGSSLSMGLKVYNNGSLSSGYSYVGYYLSEDTNITTSDYRLGTDYVSSLSAGYGSIESFTLDINTLSSVPNSTYYVGFLVDYNGNVTEVKENDNSWYSKSTLVTLAPRPNLTYESSYNKIDVFGDDATISLKLKNDGDTVSEAFNIGYYLSTNSSISTTDTYLDKDYVESISTSQTIDKSFSINAIDLSSQVSSGYYYLGYIIDYEDDVLEKSEFDNNYGYSSRTIYVPENLNLSYDSANCSVSTSGTQVGISMRITNSGNKFVSNTKVGYYLSADMAISDDDIYIGNDYAYSLSGGDYSSESIYLELKSLGINIPAGTYYIGFNVDYENSISEQNETDNFWVHPTTTITISTDIGANLFSNNNDVTVNGNNVMISLLAENNGSSNTGSFYIGYYLSVDKTITTDDLYISYDYVGSLLSGSSSNQNFTGDVTSYLTTIPKGTYYIGYIIDYLENINETNENDNSWCHPTKTLVIDSDIGPNLTYEPSSNSISISGTEVSYSLNIVNNGTSTAGYSHTGYYLSIDTNITTDDYFITFYSVESLPVSGNSIKSFSCDVTDRISVIPAGTYYVGYIIDHYNFITEYDETDNSWFYPTEKLTISSPIGPNLTSNSSLNLVSVNNDEISISLSATNIGTSFASSSYVGYYLSTDKEITTDDIFLGSDYISRLNSGSSSIENITASTSSLNLKNGTYYIGYIIDYEDVVTEYNEDDNTWYSADDSLVIDSNGKPNYTYGNGNITSFVSGTDIYVGFYLENSGDTIAGHSHVGLYISEDNKITTDDYLLNSQSISSMTARSNTYIRFDVDANSITPSLPNGMYYYGFILDHKDEVAESNEEDNTWIESSYRLDLDSSSRPDLEISSQTVTPSTVEATDKIATYCEVHNNGQSSSGHSKIAYYLSEDMKIDESDIFLGKDSVAVLSNSSYNSINSNSIFIPWTDVAATKYILFYADAENQIIETSETNNVKSFLINIKPSSSRAVLITSTTTLSLPSGLIDASASFKIISNTSWTITSDVSWLDIDFVKGGNSQDIIVSANETNNTTAERKGILTISGNGTSSLTVTVTQGVKVGISTISDAASDNAIIYPNPTNSKLYVKFDNPVTTKKILVFDNSGNCKMSVDKKRELQLLELDLVTFPTGLYFIQIQTDETVITKKVMVVR